MTDVAVIGGGIAGCATAAFLAEAGAAVTLYEREAIAAGASGRNSGILQHPMDAALVALYEESLALYATLGHGFELPAETSGVLLVSQDGEALARDFGSARARFPELEPEWLEGDALRAEEPALGPGIHAYRLHTGRPIGPTAATRAWAERARAAGARFEIGVEARARELSAGVVVVAAGPWTPAALGARPDWRPVYANWGVVAQVRLPRPPRHSLEQAGIEALTAPGGAAGALFSLVTTGDGSAVGSTFDPEPPDAAFGRTRGVGARRSLPPRARGRADRAHPCVRAAAVGRRASPAGTGGRPDLPRDRPRRLGRHARPGVGAGRRADRARRDGRDPA